MSEQNDVQSEARLAILKAIPEAVKELQKHNGPSQAEGLYKLSEALAWLITPSNPH